MIAAERIDFVHAQPDGEVAFLARHRDDVDAATFLPRTETVDLCQDKARFADAIRAAGLPSPEFFHVESEDDLREETARILGGHAKAWVRAVRGAGARASLPVTTPEQAVSWMRYWVETRGLEPRDFMVTQFLPGREFAFQSLWQEGRLVTSQARERVEYLFGSLVPSGQTSTPSVARTVRRDDVNELAIAAIHALDPNATGIFCADLKEDERGVPLLTEINAGRFFTTSNFFAVAGLNMPYEYVRLGLGETAGELPERDGLEEGLYWVRMIDMGYKLVPDGDWASREVAT
ncbi:MAG: ATP-grasp domain-containing protein [Actinomycetota bacterium]|nr:ATP-grasp domain-containing protein [Actinomycetota bacterium]